MHKFVDQGQAAGRVSGVEAAETGQGQAGSVLGKQTGEKRWKAVHNTEDNLATGTCGCVT